MTHEAERIIAELEAANQELTARNDELERFAYTVSHDLKSPLVTIKGFVSLLRRDMDAGNDGASRQDMAHIVDAADKMERLLDELLRLSRVGRIVNPSERIPLAELAREAAALVAGPIEERGVTLEVPADMPHVFADRVRVLEVYQNLIENAVKFMRDQPDPRIELGASRRLHRVLAWVRDNGIGIDPRHHTKVFGLFDRVDEGIDGTGIGLALVRRIVEVHGGDVWVESDGLGEGSTFYFTLPAEPAPEPALPEPSTVAEQRPRDRTAP